MTRVTTMPSPQGTGKIVFRSAPAFWSGCIAVTVGVLLHMPMLYSARSMHYRLNGMAIDPTMIVGMILIAAGLVLAGYGVAPPMGATVSADEAHQASHWGIAALDNVALGREHWKLIGVLGTGLIIDIMKPASLAFVVPGMKAEYGLSASVVALFPLSALSGTFLGSLIWGRFGDVVGRRATILFAALVFMGTAICAAMPGFGYNVIMCFVMGLSAGGLLPIAIALLAEMMPVRSRAPVVVLLGGIGAAGGYLVASWAATLLVPTFSWRVMWLLNLPTGMILVFLNRYIPESPRFLLSRGRVEEADVILRRFGAGTVTANRAGRESPQMLVSAHAGASALFKQPYLSQTAAVAMYGIAWGLVNYGFFLWLPSNLQTAGFGMQTASGILAKSALVAFPGALLVTWLYMKWSSKKTLVLASFLTGLSLLAFVPLAATAQHHTFLLAIVIIALLVSANGMTSTLLPYSTEVYPTSIRTTGSGIAAGGGKFGGVFGIGAVAAHLTPTLAVAAPLVAVPVAIAMVVLSVAGRETRGRRLEESSGEEPVQLLESVGG